MADDEFLKALTALEAALADNQERTRLIKKRITQLRRLRANGASYTEIVATRNGPLLVQLVTESSTALDTSGASVRRAEASALYAEGLTMDQIAERFGVTRQRVSTLLRKSPQ
jgi:Homeodomain-like domain